MVEAAGVEPASENASDRASTRVGQPIEVSRSPAAAGLRARQANEISISMCWRVRRSSLIVSVLSSYRRKLEEPSLPEFFRQREQQRYRSQLQCLPLFTWPGAPRRATRTSTSPSKPLRPLVKEHAHYGVGEGLGQCENACLARWRGGGSRTWFPWWRRRRPGCCHGGRARSRRRCRGRGRRARAARTGAVGLRRGSAGRRGGP